MAAWSDFVGATQVSDIQGKFSALLSAVDCESVIQATAMPGSGLGVFRALVEAKPRLPPRFRDLVGTLQRRMALAQYGDGEACAGVRTAIIGGGPVGLRCAVELALLGSSVTVIEGRSSWT